MVSLERVQLGARRVAGLTTIALGFTIPISVAADGILVVLLVVSWLAGGEWKERVHRIITNPVAASVILLFGWLLLGTLWGEGALQDRSLAIKKYADLLLIPLFISMAIHADDRNRALRALAASLVVTLLLSLFLGSGFLPSGMMSDCDESNPCLFKTLDTCDPSSPCIFKKRITHNVLMAFGALLFAVLAWRSHKAWVRGGWSLVSLLALSNVVLMVQGRTGYVVLAALVIVALQVVFGWRGVAGAIIILVLMFSGAYHVSPGFHDRVNLTASNIIQGKSKEIDVATHERLEFYRYTFKVIEDHPIMGAGTGGFSQAYEVHAKPAGVRVPAHPHNQYLMIMAQVGIVGGGLLLWLFVQQWKSALRVSDATYGLLARGLVVTMVVGCLFNTFLIDHTEKLFYCWLSGLLYSGSDAQVATRV